MKTNNTGSVILSGTGSRMVSGIATIMLALLMVLSMVPLFGVESYAASDDKAVNIGADVLRNGANSADARLVHVGDRSWYVLGYEKTGVRMGETSGYDEIRLLASNNIKLAPFSKNSVRYRGSDLEKEINNYVSTSFTAEERSAIISRNLPGINVSDHDNINWWLNNYLSVDEVIGEPVNGALLWPLSAKEACQVNKSLRKADVQYWLRTLGTPEYSYYEYIPFVIDDYVDVEPTMAIVTAEGTVTRQNTKNGENPSYWNAVRPAFKLNKNDIVLTSALTGGKESAEDGTLNAVGEISGKEWKLTIQDGNHKQFSVDSCAAEPGEDGTLKIKYENARTGENEYISAIIKGADGSVKQYGRVAKATETSGTVTIKGLPEDSSGKIALNEGDELYVFNEQYNGDGKTDYSSALVQVGPKGHDWEFVSFYYLPAKNEAHAQYYCKVNNDHRKDVVAIYEEGSIPAKCEEPEKITMTYSITAEQSPDGKEHSQTEWRYEGDPLGHDYSVYSDVRWTGTTANYSKAEFIFSCSRDKSHKKYVEGTITKKVEEPTCTGMGRTVYQADLAANKSPDGKAHSSAKYGNATPKLGHDWGEPTYTWSDDNSSVTATRVCKRDPSHVETETVETTKEITTPPTCSATGLADIKTKPFKNNAFTEQTKTGQTVPIDPEAHVWDDGTEEAPHECGGSVMLYTCTQCGENETRIIGGDSHKWSEDYIVFAQPTCTELGESFRECEKCHSLDLEDPQLLDPIGHKWKFVDFTWTGDETDGYSKAVANYVCENDPSHKITAEAEIESEVIDPTCKEGGKTVYTPGISAADSPDGTAHNESKDANATDPVSHEWEYTGMEWTGNETDGYTKAVAEYKCKYNCGQADEVEATIAEKTTEPDCENEGKTKYTATVAATESLVGEAHSDTKYAKVKEALGHKWELDDFTWTGNETDGYSEAKANYVCKRDVSHKTSVEAELSENVIKATCMEDGCTLYTADVSAEDSPDKESCSDSKTAKITKATGHAWRFKGFTWMGSEKEGYRAAAEYVCSHDNSHTASVMANISRKDKAATKTEPGGTIYTATVSKERSLTHAEVKEDKFVKKTEPTPTPKPTPAKKVSGILIAKSVAKGSNALNISWTKVQNVNGYDIYLARCNHGGKKFACKKVKTIKGNKTFKWTKSGLKKGTSYKAYVKAYVYKNGKKTYVRTSPVMHAYTGNSTKNYTNAKSVSVNKTKVTLKKGKTFKIKVKVNKVKKNKKLMPKSHAATVRYLTSNSKIAAVNASGKITAKGKGTCYIYALAHNGISKQVKVTVK